MTDDVTITVRVGDHTAAGFRDIDGRIRSLDGRFATSAGSMTRSSSAMSQALVDVRASLLSLAPAAVPVAASLAPIVTTAAGAGVALGAFGAAVAGQVGHLSDASKAQTKYTDSVAQYGRGSKQAAEAARSVQSSLSSMPQATARAAVGLTTLKDGFHDWSDSLAGVTMAPVEKGFTVLGQILPKLTPMAKGAATQLDRLVTVAGGAVNTAGFDSLSKRVADFANSSIKKATDGAIHFGRVMSEGNAHGPMTEFMDYAREQGPAVKELLANLASATGNIAEGAAQAGPGLLTLVNAMAKLVAAVPPEVVGTLMQIYAAFKLIKLAGAGVAGVAGGVETLATKITALRAASAAAGGGLAGLKAAFMGLGTAAKATVVIAGIAAAVAVIGKLSSMGQEAPPNVDKLTTSLGNLARTGKASGEASRLFGKNLSDMYDSVRNITDPSTTDKVQQWGVKILSFGMADSSPHTVAKQKLDGIDEALTNLVRGGKSEIAAKAFNDLSKAYAKGGGNVGDLRKKLDGYKSALADQALEQKLAADSMGMFGTAAQQTQAQLDAQKRSADGLRASIVALNDTNRSAYDSQIAFEAGIDNLTAAFKKNGATLDIHTEKGRANGQAMSAAAKAQDEMIASGLAAGDSLSSMTKKSGELRGEMLKLATEAFDGNKKKAQEYVNTLLGAPGEIKTLVRLEREGAVAGLKEVEAAIRATPGAKKVTVSTLNGAAIKALEAVGLKTRTLPDGKTQVYTANGKALGGIAAVARALNALNGKTATTYTFHKISTTYSTSRSVSGGKSVHEMVGSANGNIFRGRTYADGGVENHVAEIAQPSMRLWAEPETGGEAYIPLSAAKRPRSMAILDDVANRFGYRLDKFAKGGLSQAEKDARGSLRGQFGISAFGRAAGYQRTSFEKGLGAPSDLSSLVSALNTARGDIKGATRGGTESRLLKQLDSVGKSLIKYDKQLGAVNKSLETAKTKLNDLKSAASSLSSSVKSSVLSSANITKGGAGGTVTVASIMSGLTASRDKASAFSGALSGLKSKGLSKDLIQQIGEAGVEGGGLETAGALLGASSSEISSVNSLQGQINSSAGAAGKTTADAVYAAAIKAQTATVSKLQKSQDKLEKTMANLAKVMEKSISRAIGKKAAGGIVGAAASGGLRGGLTWVGEHEPELLDLPVGSRVRSGPDSRRLAAMGGGGPTRVELEIRSSGGGYDEFLLRELRRAIKVRGGNVNFVLTGRP